MGPETTDVKRSTPQVLNPLWIISLFLAVSETTVGVAATQSAGWVQGLLALSATLFPLLVSAAFFTILWKKPEVFYAPKDFPEHITVPDFVHGLHRTGPVELEQVGGIVRDTLTSVLPSILQQQVPSSQVESVVHEVVSTARKELASRSLMIDVRAAGDGAARVEWIIDETMTASNLLDSLFVAHLRNVVPPYTYPQSWVLIDRATGKVFDQMGAQWAAEHSRDTDDRSLAQVGIHSGMELTVKLAEKARWTLRAALDQEP